MTFIELVNSVEDRICESKKKVSFAQRSPVDTKKSDVSKTFDDNGHSFSVSEGEVIESALFDRITRDCKGDLMRVTSVRRLRKVGSDEWYSLPASKANDIWNTEFHSTTNEEAIEQGNQNSVSEGQGQKEYATNFKKVNVREQIKKQKEKKKQFTNILIGVGITTAAFIGFGIYKKVYIK